MFYGSEEGAWKATLPLLAGLVVWYMYAQQIEVEPTTSRPRYRY
jgi:hypothetical protein